MLGYQPQQRTIIIVTNVPVDERIGHWNMVKKQYEEVECVTVKKSEVDYTMLQFYLFGGQVLVAYFATAPSQIF
jgi:hypothetical protein